MSRRGGGDTLTGGSGDVNPQTLLVGPCSQTGAVGNDQPFSIAITLPIPRLPIKKGRSLVIEVLWVEFLIYSFATAINVFNVGRIFAYQLWNSKLKLN
jgi:hypothetical protein